VGGGEVSRLVHEKKVLTGYTREKIFSWLRMTIGGLQGSISELHVATVIRNTVDGTHQHHKGSLGTKVSDIWCALTF
jgi:hypothetical protein